MSKKKLLPAELDKRNPSYFYKDIQNDYFRRRSIRVKLVRNRSNLNFFAFHLSNPVMQKIRNFFMKFLVKRKNFIKSYFCFFSKS